jgi:hypothetical protein
VQRLVALRGLRRLAMGASDIPHRRLLRLTSCLTSLTGQLLTWMLLRVEGSEG